MRVSRFFFKNFKNIVAALCFLVPCTALAQVDPAAQFSPKIFSPSPEAANLGRYGEYPVTLNNGLVNISIPIFEIKTGKLTLPISLSYHAGGVKAYDIASSVGLGWTLNAGGAITRVVLGRPDDGGSGCLSNPFPAPDDPGEHFRCFIGTMADPQFTRDGQHDLFYYKMGAASGKFMFKNVLALGVPWEAVTIPYSLTKISITPEFKIVDESGVTYTFGQSEITSVVGAQGAVYSNTPTAWYLTSIVSADKTDIISLSYTSPVVVTSINANTSLTERRSGPSNGQYEESRSPVISTHVSRNVAEIVFNNGKVVFDYAADRQDAQGNKLAGIRIFNKNNSGAFEKIREFSFLQTYFVATGGQKSQLDGLNTGGDLNKRLRLDKITEKGFKEGVQESKPPYSFEYETSSFPVLATTAQDFMGYYNGAHSNKNLRIHDLGTDQNGLTVVSEAFGANREVNSNFTKAGSLRKITYPTGGTTTFELEPNQISSVEVTPIYTSHSYELTSRELTVTERIFTPTQAMMGGALSIEASLDIDLINNYAGQPPIQTTIRLFDITANTVVALSQSSGNATWDILSTTSTLVQKVKVMLTANHTYRLSYLNTFPVTNNFFFVKLSWKYVSGQTSNTTTRFAGGLRIKAIVNDDGQNNVLKKTYTYTKAYYNSNLFNGSVASLGHFYLSRYKDVYVTTPIILSSLVDYINYGENCTFQLGSTSGMTVSYEEVEEHQVDGLNNSIGKVVTTFNKAIDGIPSLAPFFRTDWEWKRSQIASRRIYKSNSNSYVLLKEEVSQYDYESVGQIKSYVSKLTVNGVRPYDPACPTCGTIMLRTCNIVATQSEYSWFDLDQPIYRSNEVSTTTVEYDENGQNPVTSQTQYFYENPKHQQLTKTIKSQSDGRMSFNAFQYPLDHFVGICPSNCLTEFNTSLSSPLSLKRTCEALFYPQYLSAQGQGNTSAADAAYSNYLGCGATYQGTVQALIANYNSCVATSISCMNSAISSSVPSKASILSMQKENVISKVVQQTEGVWDNGTELVTSGMKTDFKILANGSTEPEFIWGFNSQTAVGKTVFDANPPSFLRKVGAFISYDVSNNIEALTRESDNTISYLWDYKNEYPVAEIQNANLPDVAYTSFEAEGAGNFIIPPGGRIIASSRTGRQSYSLANGALSKSGLVLAKKYVINFWAKSGAVVHVNGITVSPTANSPIDDWKYFETSVTNVTSVNVSGVGTIDELRLYLAGAKITTYTYDPLIGVTSRTDSNSNTTFFEYDPLGRLVIERDSQKQILRTHKYNYKQQ
jgi:YD repeat-containing protein